MMCLQIWSTCQGDEEVWRGREVCKIYGDDIHEEEVDESCNAVAEGRTVSLFFMVMIRLNR